MTEADFLLPDLRCYHNIWLKLGLIIIGNRLFSHTLDCFCCRWFLHRKSIHLGSNTVILFKPPSIYGCTDGCCENRDINAAFLSYLFAIRLAIQSNVFWSALQSLFFNEHSHITLTNSWRHKELYCCHFENTNLGPLKSVGDNRDIGMADTTRFRKIKSVVGNVDL